MDLTASPAGVRHGRLRDIRILVNRALVLSALIAVIGGVYVFGVVRTDALFGLDSDWLAPPQVAAVGLVALAFHPLRVRGEKLADRLVYGRRATPYEVLAAVSALSQASGPGPAALAALARIAAQGLATDYVAVHLDLRDGTEAVYQWPLDAPTPAAQRLIPVTYRGARVGALAIPGGPGRQLGRGPTRHRRALLDDFVRSAGVILHNASLSIELEHRLHTAEQRTAEIRASRWRIVAAQDSERRELERDLHDGAQPGLTAVRLSLGLVTHLARSGKSAAARDALSRLLEQIDGASAGLSQTLRGLDPPALNQFGVARALRELALSLGSTTTFEVGSGVETMRFSPEIEAAVYFCCAEALQNTVKHCPDAPTALQLDAAPDCALLRFAVIDQGPGFDPPTASTGSGLQNMADRIAAVGGNLTITSSRGAGTTVSGSVPR